ncbi:MAG TPA: hypothetical protein ENK09_00325 [Nitrospirae bacterium]|nr:hypothetical protein [Nitrospirota bacterium]
MKVEGINKVETDKISKDIRDLAEEKKHPWSVKKKDEEKNTLSQEKKLEIEVINRSIRFEIDKELHRVIAKVIDRKTGEIIRQVPPEEAVRIAKFLLKSGLIFNREA